MMPSDVNMLDDMFTTMNVSAAALVAPNRFWAFADVQNTREYANGIRTKLINRELLAELKDLLKTTEDHQDQK